MPNHIKSLTILWAMSECILGGIMHAFKIPFTGLTVGSFSIICIGLIAIYSEGDRPTLLKSLGLVLSVKLLASPHSPWQAYVAVAFQGGVGFLLLCHTKSPGKLAILVFAIISLLESALQKVLILILIYGQNFFNALDELALQLINRFGFSADFSASMQVLYIYVIVHLIMAIIIGFWIPAIPLEIEVLRTKIPIDKIINGNPIENQNPKNPRIHFRKLLRLAILISIPALVYILLPGKGKELIIYMIIRVVLVSVFLLYVIGPLIKHLFFKLLRPNRERNRSLTTIIEMIPRWKVLLQNSIIWVQDNYKGLQRLKYLLLTLMLISLEINDSKN